MNSNINLLVDIKKEYTKELISMLTPCIYEGIKSIYDAGKPLNKQNNILRTFQNLLSQIPNWNSNILNKETERIKAKCNCEWLPDLIKAVIISNTVVLSNSNKKGLSNELKATQIDLDKFIHICYIETAREFFKNPYLLYDGLKPWEIQSNMRESYKIIKESVEESVRKMLPFDNILKEYLKSDFLHEDIQSESIVNNSSHTRNQNIGNLVRKHLRDDIFDLVGGDRHSNDSSVSHSETDSDLYTSNTPNSELSEYSESSSPRIRTRHSHNRDLKNNSKSENSSQKKSNQMDKEHSNNEKRDSLNNHRRSSENKKHSSNNHRRSSENKKHYSNEHRRSSENKKHSSNEHRRRSENKKHSSNEHRRSSENKKHYSNEHRRSSERRNSSNKTHSSNDRKHNHSNNKNEDKNININDSNHLNNQINELSENILIKQKSNSSNYNVLESIREDDIKNKNNIDIAEVYSNFNH